MLDWSAVGNGWRNLYLLSSLVQALALGLFFAKRRLWVKRSRLGAFLAGAALTPLIQYLWTLLLALAWPQASKWVYIGVLPLIAAVYLLVTALGSIRRIVPLTLRAWAWLKRLLRMDRAALVSLCFTLAMAILLAPICIRAATDANVAQADAGEYMALGLRYCEDRDLGALLDKDDATGHFRGNSHFPSLELYMAYGLMHTSDTYGYPYDKPMITGLGLLVFYLLSAFSALLIQVTRGKKRWILLGLLLFNLVPNYVFSLFGAARDSWRCLAILAAAVALCELRPQGDWKRYLGKLALMTGLCFTVMSTHVVSFVVLPFLVVAWVLLCWLEALYRREGSAGRTLLRSAGLALGGAAGTLAAYAGNIWCYLQWGQFSPWRLMTTYTDAPWYQLYLQGEYKLEETTTHLNFWKDRYDIVMAYATPIGLWGLRLAVFGLAAALVVLIVRRLRIRREVRSLLGDDRKNGPVAVFVRDTEMQLARAERVRAVLAASLFTLFTLVPMSGLLDTHLYSFSGSFLTLQRYTLQWFMLACVTIAAVLAAAEAEWPQVLGWVKHAGGRTIAALRGRWPGAGLWARRVPALLGALLCVLAFAQGTSESGYANSFYRYGRPMLTDESTAQDTGFLQRYTLLLKLNDLVPQDEKILVTRPGYQYALHAKGYVLTSNPIVPLMNLPLSQVGDALRQMNVAAICTEPDFWDERYYALSTLSEYLNSLPDKQIIDDGTMRVYLLDESLIGKLTAGAETPEAAGTV
ncbi:MAG: hypothetical protein LLF96_02045 [Eubacteriales bacterium]|nr:hypothetical protein [Eubacteriales bacterium]